MSLTGKVKAFADAVLAGKSNKEAAIVAGYSGATASQAGSRLAKNPKVVAYLIARRSEQPAAPSTVAAPPAPEVNPFDLNIAILHADPKNFLIAAMNDPTIEPKLRIDAGKALMPFFHGKIGEAGKKAGKADAAKSAGGGRFGAAAPPKLVVHNK